MVKAVNSFYKENSIVDVGLGSKYASKNTYEVFLPNKRNWGSKKDFFYCRHGHERIKFFNVSPSLCLLEILI